MDKHEKILYTTKYGTYYNPAGRHYADPLANCICDNCGKQNLISCIGHSDVDVCLPCVERLNNEPYGIHVNKSPGVMCNWPTPM